MFRVARDVCAVSAQRTAVIDDLRAAVAADLESPCVGERLTVLQCARCLQLFDERLATNLPGIEVLVPVQKVANRREHAAGTGALVRWRVEAKAVRADDVRVGASLDEA